MNSVVLEAQALSKTFSEGLQAVDVLKKVSLTIHRGEFIAIVGSSGSGKSTLLHILGGLDVPSSGSVTILGQPLSVLNETKRGELRNKHLGFVYQFHHLLAEFTAFIVTPKLFGKRSRNRRYRFIDKSGLGASFAT